MLQFIKLLIVTAAIFGSIVIAEKIDKKELSNSGKSPITDASPEERNSNQENAKSGKTHSVGNEFHDSSVVFHLKEIVYSQNNSSEQAILQFKAIASKLDTMTEGIKKILMLQQKLNPTVLIDESSQGVTNNDEIRLHQYLHSKNREITKIRPTVRPETITLVTLNVDLFQIIEMNEAEEFFKAYLHINMSFTNELLGWNPEDFGGIENTHLDALDEMWMPDIFAYNGVSMLSEDTYFRPIPRMTTKKVKIGYSKTAWQSVVAYSYPRIVKFSCSFDTFYFPFDYQLCVMTFRSWSYPKNKIYIIPGYHLKNLTKENEEWDIVDTALFSKIMKSRSSSEMFSVYEQQILMKRRSLYYVLNLLIPSVIITQVAFLGFFSPSSSDGDRTEKVNLGMATLLAMSVLLLSVCGMTPFANSNQIPLTGIFFLANMVLISIGVLVTTAIMYVDQRGKRKKRVPNWIRSFLFFRMAPKLGFKIPSPLKRSQASKSEAETAFLDDDINIEHAANGDISIMNELPQIRKLNAQIDSMIRGRRRELAEVEFIFLAKILDVVMLIFFSSILYCVTGCVVFIALIQPSPKWSLENSMFKNSDLHKDELRRLIGEFKIIVDTNHDGEIQYDEYNRFFLDHNFAEEEVHFFRMGGLFNDNFQKLEGTIWLFSSFGPSKLETFQEFDSDSDDHLSENEFLELCTISNYEFFYWNKGMVGFEWILSDYVGYERSLTVRSFFTNLPPEKKRKWCQEWFRKEDVTGDGKMLFMEIQLLVSHLKYDMEKFYQRSRKSVDLDKQLQPGTGQFG